MAWKLPPSIIYALAEADDRWPARSKASDGTIGDPDHSARESDHNPGARDYVHAFDLTDDPADGCDCDALVAHLLATRDPRVKYIIWDRTIWRSYDRQATSSRPFLKAWEPEPYTGPNPHDKHMHVSILSTLEAELDTREWWDVLPPEEEDELAYRYDAIRHVDTKKIALTAAGFFKHVTEEELLLAQRKAWCPPKEQEVNAREWDLARALAFGGEEPEAERTRD